MVGDCSCDWCQGRFGESHGSCTGQVGGGQRTIDYDPCPQKEACTRKRCCVWERCGKSKRCGNCQSYARHTSEHGYCAAEFDDVTAPKVGKDHGHDCETFLLEGDR